MGNSLGTVSSTDLPDWRCIKTASQGMRSASSVKSAGIQLEEHILQGLRRVEKKERRSAEEYNGWPAQNMRQYARPSATLGSLLPARKFGWRRPVPRELWSRWDSGSSRGRRGSMGQLNAFAISTKCADVKETKNGECGRVNIAE